MGLGGPRRLIGARVLAVGCALTSAVAAGFQGGGRTPTGTLNRSNSTLNQQESTGHSYGILDHNFTDGVYDQDAEIPALPFFLVGFGVPVGCLVVSALCGCFKDIMHPVNPVLQVNPVPQETEDPPIPLHHAWCIDPALDALPLGECRLTYNDICLNNADLFILETADSKYQLSVYSRSNATGDFKYDPYTRLPIRFKVWFNAQSNSNNNSIGVGVQAKLPPLAELRSLVAYSNGGDTPLMGMKLVLFEDSQGNKLACLGQSLATIRVPQDAQSILVFTIETNGSLAAKPIGLGHATGTGESSTLSI